jgi:D-glycero-D-manno-heptose 1,7-bisphosphate phosphatase
MVGDRWKDIEAGRRAGCRTFYVQADYRERAPPDPDFRVESLADAARVLLALGAQ